MISVLVFIYLAVRYGLPTVPLYNGAKKVLFIYFCSVPIIIQLILRVWGLMHKTLKFCKYASWAGMQSLCLRLYFNFYLK